MKKTELKDVYCVLKTDEDWTKLGLKSHVYAEKSAVFWSYDMPMNNGVVGPTNPHLLKLQGRTEIPAQHFIDLLEDRIVPWRLEEIGFNNQMVETPFFNVECENELVYIDGSITPLNISTFTELVQLLKFLGYEKNKKPY